MLFIRKRLIRWIAGIAAGLALLGCGYYLILDWEGRPFCHKQIMFGFLNVMHESGDVSSTDTPFPNVNGSSQESLATICESMNYTNWVEMYNYVPGLRENDPEDLVLLYVNRPTRWTWHGPAPTVFQEKKWIIVPLDFGNGTRQRSGPGECSERISAKEFRERLTHTLDFVRTNERPHWQEVVAQHQKVLDSLNALDR